MPDPPIIAYCLRCRQKQAMQATEPAYTASGAPATRGKCSVCNSSMFRMGRTEAHAFVPMPDVQSSSGPSSRKKPHQRAKKRARAQDKLVIVESPAKARTLQRFLGKNYRVEASVGHVRDLLRSRLSVDIENRFQPTYRVPNEKRKVVRRLKEAASRAKEVYLATDPDREGEAIAWHLLAAADIPENAAQRVTFHEMTEPAVAEAFANPRNLDMDLINAQQARRILDRLVGYQISPLLWRNVRSRLSAGRVQSVAVRLVVEREREIEEFVSVEYWSISAELAAVKTQASQPRSSFVAKLLKINAEDVDLGTKSATQAVVDDLERAQYFVSRVRKSRREKRSPSPFITSTLQQEASSKLGLTPRRTMAIAQQLYEGVDLGQGERVGLITYMRTDSTNVSAQALGEARSYIAEKFGMQFLPAKPPKHSTRAVRAQEAHECIRPTSVRREPDAIKAYLDRGQYRLYRLIWQRLLASQMKPAIYDVVSADIKAGHLDSESALELAKPKRSVLEALPYLFRATSSTLAFAGFLLVYAQMDREKEESDPLPPLAAGQPLDLLRLIPEQHFTRPPPRYTEAALIRDLEKHGVGRPSTYAPILSTIQARGYVDRLGKNLLPTELGFIVNDLLVKHFPEVVNLPFTARMEASLDEIAAGDRNWTAVLAEFYEPFARELQEAERNMQKVDLQPEMTGQQCEKCGHPMIVKVGRYGKFIACSNYPECRNTKPYVIDTGAKCPQCGGNLVAKRTRKRRTFFGCSTYPNCEFALWKRPVPQPCPACGGLMVESSRKRLECTQCQQTLERQVQAEDSA
jgi:DNA topoisomerase-1